MEILLSGEPEENDLVLCKLKQIPEIDIFLTSNFSANKYCINTLGMIRPKENIYLACNIELCKNKEFNIKEQNL